MSRRRRIMMTVDAVGGVWHYAGELAEALAGQDCEILLTLLGPAPSDSQRQRVGALSGVRLIETGLPLDWLATGPAEVDATAARIAAIARDEGADLVHLNQPALAASTTFAVPIVAAVHSCVATWWEAAGCGEAPADFIWQTELVGRGLARADVILCPSQAFADAIARHYDLSTPPRVVHNGRRPLARHSGAIHDFAFTAGRLWDAGKNVATLDRAAARLGIPFKAAGPLVGPNGERLELAAIHRLGSLEEPALARCLSARPVFVSAARYEPFGLAVLEAALAGCALVLSDIASFRELWGDAALFVAPDDAIGFADAIEYLIGDLPARLDLGERARGRAQRYTPSRMAAQIDAIYRSLAPAETASEGRVAA
jgi:glycosyltransferase involved in cell wall biosynthesis